MMKLNFCKEATLVVAAIIAAAADGDPEHEKTLIKGYFRCVDGVYDEIRRQGGPERRR
jgi:hypothetical protein